MSDHSAKDLKLLISISDHNNRYLVNIQGFYICYTCADKISDKTNLCRATSSAIAINVHSRLTWLNTNQREGQPTPTQSPSSRVDELWAGQARDQSSGYLETIVQVIIPVPAHFPLYECWMNEFARSTEVCIVSLPEQVKSPPPPGRDCIPPPVGPPSDR